MYSRAACRVRDHLIDYVPGRFSASTARRSGATTSRTRRARRRTVVRMRLRVDGRGVLWKSPVMYLGLPLVYRAGRSSARGALCGFCMARRSISPRPRRVQFMGPLRLLEVVATRALQSPMCQPGGLLQRWKACRVRRCIYLTGRGGCGWRFADFCDRDLSGFLSCLFEGQRVSGQVHYYPPVASGVSAASVMPAFLAPASPSQSPPPTR